MGTAQQAQSERTRLGAVPIITARQAALMAQGADAWVFRGRPAGDPAFWRGPADPRPVRFHPVGETHDDARLAVIPGFASVSAVVEIDLLGQTDAERMARRQVDGQGGPADFLRGARALPGRRAMMARPATARGQSAGPEHRDSLSAEWQKRRQHLRCGAT